MTNRKPIVVIDARMVFDIPHGIARYVSLLSKGLAELNSENQLPYELLFLVAPSGPSQIFSPFETVSVSAPFLHPKELIEIPSILKQIEPALYHSPSFSSLWSCPCPSIITIHDLNHLTFGDWKQKIYYQLLLRRFSKRSKAIVTVSEFSRREIAKWLHRPEGTIDIVYNSIERIDFQSHSLFKFQNLEVGKYFFCLSNSKPHKNLNLLVQAYERFQHQQKNAWPLVLTTDPFPTQLPIQFLGPQPEENVTTLLKNAGGALFPSRYEGFGLPPVEAAVVGCPLAVSRIPPHEEGLVDLKPHEVHWVDSNDLFGWVQAFHRLMKREITFPSLESQNKILARFHWKKMAQSMDRIYRKQLFE